MQTGQVGEAVKCTALLIGMWSISGGKHTAFQLDRIGGTMAASA